jgi:hypothetical protein
MQTAAGIGADAHDVAGIGRDFRLVENDFKHWLGRVDCRNVGKVDRF